MVIFGIINNAGVGGVKYFFDAASAIITFGGAFAAILASTTMADFVGGLKSFSLAIKTTSFDVTAIIRKIIDLSNVARKEGLLSLEEAAGDLEDEFLKKGILLVVDGTDPELVRAIMETELVSMNDRHKSNISFWEDVATMGPAWGMIGTLIGLVLMIQNMDDWLLRYAGLAKKHYRKADENYPGTGAAGGLGFAFLTFTNAVLESGIKIILTETQLEKHIQQADIVITGEGRLDGQTAMGKAPVGVAELAKKYSIPVIAFAGSVTEDAKNCNQRGIDAFFSILREITTLEEAMQPENAKNNLRDTAEQVFRLIYMRKA